MKNSKHRLPFVIIFGISIFVWYKVLGQALVAEGPAYYSSIYFNMIDDVGIAGIAHRYDVQAFLFFHYIGVIFKTEMIYYMMFQLVTVAVIGYCLYLFIYQVTKNRFSGIVASIFLIANHAGSFDMLGHGYYNYFIERVPNFILALLSALFLVKYFQDKKIKHYLISFALYVLAVWLARYTLFMVPLFCIFPIINALTSSKRSLKKYLNSILITFPFVYISYKLLVAQELVTSNTKVSSLIGFIVKRPSIYGEVLKEITFTVIHPNLIRSFHSFINTLDPSGFFVYDIPQIIKGSTVLVTVAIVLFTILIYRSEKKVRGLLLTVVFSLPCITLLQIYINPSFVNTFSTSRYLYLPSMIFAMFWGIVFWWLWKKGKIQKGIVILILFLWLIYNKNLINKDIRSWQERHNIVLSTIDYVCDNNLTFPENAIVYLPSENGYYGSAMLELFCGRDDIMYLPEEGVSKEKLIELEKKYDKTMRLYNKIPEVDGETQE